MPNPPKPTTLKMLAGNPGKRPLNRQEPDPGTLAITPPENLSEGAKTQWMRLAPMLTNAGVLKASDRDVLEHYCEAYVEYYRQLREDGKLNCSLLAQMRQMLGELGMTPASRTRIVADPPKEKTDGKARFFG